LVIALHPLGSNPLLMESMTAFSSADDIIAAYPEGTKISEDGTRSWNAGFCCRDAREVNADDIGFLSALIDDLADRYAISGVLITGFSNGGMLAHLAGIELSNKVTAIAPVAAAIGPNLLGMSPRRPLPVLMVHGTADRILPMDGFHEGNILPASAAIDLWVRANGCRREPTRERRGGIEVERHAPCSGDAEVLFYKVDGAGHVWPGSRVRMRSESDPGTMDASAVILGFFRSHLR